MIDFGVIKSVFGGWLDQAWDHGAILHADDTALIELCKSSDWKVYTLDANPTSEVMARYLLGKASEMLGPLGVTVTHVRLYETPNCWADHYAPVKAGPHA